MEFMLQNNIIGMKLEPESISMCYLLSLLYYFIFWFSFYIRVKVIIVTLGNQVTSFIP